MATPAKTSYHDNVAVFQEIISFCVAMGPKYNPSSKDLQLTNLQAVVGEATECLSKLDKAIVATEDTATERKEAFQKLKKIITPLRNAINASDLPPLAVTDLLDLLNAVAVRL